MLQDIRDRSQSWIVKIIIGAVVIAMAMFGVESLFSLVGSDGDEIASVNGETITRQQLELNVQRAIRSGQVAPEQERQVRAETLEGMISERLLNQYIEKGGLYLSDDQLDQVIVNLPEFQDAQGRFSSELFRNRLSSAGFTPLAFRQQLRSDLARRQLEEGLVNSDFNLDREQQRLLELQRQVRSFRYHSLTADDLEQTIEVSDADRKAYYQAHEEDYLRPEQVKLDYVVIDRQQMADEVEVDEAQLREAWGADAANVDRRLSHIMLTFGDERSREEAVAKLEETRARLAEGESFADLAAEVSEDASSSAEGGDLGIVSRGFFDEAFEQAAFALDEGQVSDVVETDNGLHLIQVTELARETFEEAREQLAKRLALTQVEDDFNSRVQQLIDESFAADDLDSVAEDLALERQTTDWLGRDQDEGIFAEPGVQQQAFSSDVLSEGFNSEVIELDKDRRMVLRVREHRDATTLPLDEVREEVTAAVTRQQTLEALTARGEEMLAALREGDDLAADWPQVSVTRQQSVRLPGEVVDRVFRLAHPEDGQATFGQAAAEGEVVLIALDSVSQGEANPELETFVTRMSEQVRTSAVLGGLQQYLRDQGKVERH